MLNLTNMVSKLKPKPIEKDVVIFYACTKNGKYEIEARVHNIEWVDIKYKTDGFTMGHVVNTHISELAYLLSTDIEIARRWDGVSYIVRMNNIKEAIDLIPDRISD
jgi:hypothetical protein